MSASHYVSSENCTTAKKSTACGTAVQTTVADRLNRLLGGMARSLELEARSQLK